MQNGNVPGQNTPKHIAPPKVGYDYYYLGDQLIEEAPIYADGTFAFEHSTHWLYAPNQLTPTARYQQGQLNYVITDPIGTPTELLAKDGTGRWRVKHNLWGSILKQYSANDDDFCNLRFPGQYLDNESGLHYNRYYDPNTAQYLTPDPIGLAGGFNPYSYVHNPTGWIDPLGLAGTDCYKIPKLPEWSAHGYKHFPPKNMSWKEIVNSTKSGPAKYKHGLNIKEIEFDVISSGMPVSNGKPWKVKDMGEIIGASEGKPSQWIRVELSGGTIHAHPISLEEYLRLTK